MQICNRFGSIERHERELFVLKVSRPLVHETTYHYTFLASCSMSCLCFRFVWICFSAFAHRFAVVVTDRPTKPLDNATGRRTESYASVIREQRPGGNNSFIVDRGWDDLYDLTAGVYRMERMVLFSAALFLPHRPWQMRTKMLN